MFSPMLASDITDINRVRFPVLASTKLDGIRATVQDNKLYTRSLKLVPNLAIQKLFAGIPNGLDGELIDGNVTDEDVYRRTVSTVMSQNKPVNNINFHVFDKFGKEGFEDRLSNAFSSIDKVENVTRMLDTGNRVQFVQHVLIKSVAELEQLEEAWLQLGHEGVMLRSLKGPYKEGRSSENEGYLLKLKRFDDTEALVYGSEEQMHNNNPAQMDNLGYTERSTCKSGMVPADTLGALLVRGLADPFKDVEFKVGGGFTAKLRKDLWKVRSTLPGKIAKVKYFTIGSKDKPRFPVFLGWRDARDL